jgi:hypothetical protein
LPTACGKAPEFSAEGVGTWQNESLNIPSIEVAMHNNMDEPVGITGCEKLVHFQPTVSISPDTSFADTPAGLSVDLSVPQGVNSEGLATSGLKDTTVTLPEGVVINPGQATGLQACQSGKGLGDDDLPPTSAEGEGEAWEGPPECPSASKVGTDEISTPLLPDKLEGNVYIRQSDPPELKLLIAASGDGVNLKLVGTVHLNEATGQLTTTFNETPDVPFTNFKLSFSGGAQAALATPTACGVYGSAAQFTPWSTPFVEEAFFTSSFAITAGPGGSACASPLPFSPSMTAGATTDQAGGYTSFTMLLSRGDGQQRIERLQFKTPEGLLGMISKVPLCQEPQAATGECSEASQIGHTVAEAGPGPYPFTIPQAGAPPAPIYLTGPYDGAPFGLSIVTPVVAGPFNLGTNVVRAKIEINPITTQITVTTNPSGPHSIPTILDGIPTDVRSINAIIDRPGFMFNPTNCNPTAFTGTARSDEGASAPLSYRFQVGSCQSLKFAPDFKVSTAGKTSKADGASLAAKIVYPTGNLGANQASSQSNTASAKVDLPKQLPSRLTTLQKACAAAQFEANPARVSGGVTGGSCDRNYADPAGPVDRPGVLRQPRRGSIPEPDRRATRLRRHRGPRRYDVHQQSRNHVQHVQGNPRCSVLELRTGIAGEAVLGVDDEPAREGQLQPLRTELAMPTAFNAQNGAVIHESTPIGVTGCSKIKALTRAQKLTKALKACRKKKGSKRAGCERVARKQYGAVRSKKK